MLKGTDRSGRRGTTMSAGSRTSQRRTISFDESSDDEETKRSVSRSVDQRRQALSRSPTPIIKSTQSPRSPRTTTSDKQVSFDSSRFETRFISDHENDQSGVSDSERAHESRYEDKIENYQYLFECNEWVKNSKKKTINLTKKIRIS